MDAPSAYSPISFFPAMLREPARDIPVSASFDVVIAGGGVGGVAAAVAAARTGVSVCLLERYCALGGLATLGNVIDWLPLCDGRGRQVIAGLSEELLRRVVRDVRRECWPARFERFPECWEPGGSEEERRKRRLRACFNPDAALLAFEELLANEGVAIRYDTRVVGAVRGEGRITHLLIEDKDGRSAIVCGAVVDATGDADICAAAGEQTAVFTGNSPGGWYYTLRDGDSFELRYSSEDDRPKNKSGPFFRGDRAADVSAFLLASRRRLRDGLARLRAKNPGADIQPLHIPTFPCMLKTRRLVGAATLAESDMHRWRDDAVSLCGDWRRTGPVWASPMGALSGVVNANLAACGRCISADESVWDATRVIPVCAVTGEAAGIAAALAVQRNGGSVATLPPCAVADEMRARGNLLSPDLVAERLPSGVGS